MAFSFRPPVTEMPPDQMMVGMLQDGQWSYDALTGQDIGMLSWPEDAQEVYRLALAPTPGAVLLGGVDPQTPYLTADPVASATKRFRRQTAAATPQPFVIRGTFKGQLVVSYVSGILAEYDPAAGKDTLTVQMRGTTPAYTWA